MQANHANKLHFQGMQHWAQDFKGHVGGLSNSGAWIRRWRDNVGLGDQLEVGHVRKESVLEDPKEPAEDSWIETAIIHHVEGRKGQFQEVTWGCLWEPPLGAGSRGADSEAGGTGEAKAEDRFQGRGETVRTEAEPHRAYMEGRLLTTVLSFLISSNFPDHQTTVMDGSTTRHRTKAHTNGCNLNEGIHSIRKQNSDSTPHAWSPLRTLLKALKSKRPLMSFSNRPQESLNIPGTSMHAMFPKDMIWEGWSLVHT